MTLGLTMESLTGKEMLWFSQSRCDDCHPGKLNRQERKV